MAFDPATASYDGTNGDVYGQTMWDPDGSGPKPAQLVLVGRFTVASDAAVVNIATHDLATGHAQAMGSGLGSGNGFDWASTLATSLNGDLIAGGRFELAGTKVVSHIARWDGSAWSSLGGGVSGDGQYLAQVSTLALLPGGDVVAGGRFAAAGGVAAAQVARWSNGGWSPLGTGLNTAGGGYAAANCSVALANGDLVFGGDFTHAGSTLAHNVARWKSTGGWSALQFGVNGSVLALATMPGGDLVVAGTFSIASGVPANSIARWDGASWSALGSGIAGIAWALLPRANGDLLVGGGFSDAGGSGAKSLAVWRGSQWLAFAPPIENANVYSLVELPSGLVGVGGGFHLVSGALSAHNHLQSDGGTWSAIAPSGVSGVVRAIATQSSGSVVIAGDVGAVGSMTTNGIARWNGTVWSSLDGGMSHPFYWRIQAVVAMPNGDVIAGGKFSHAGGASANNVARWDGDQWWPLGEGINSDVYALGVMADGEVVAGGWFGSAGGVPATIARWNGSAWSAVATTYGGPVAPTIQALRTLPDGDLIAGGAFTSLDGVGAKRIARWRANTGLWAPLSAGFDGPTYPHVTSIEVLSNGDIVAGGRFTSSGGAGMVNVARWDGVQWLPMGEGLTGPPSDYLAVKALTVLPNGDLVAGGTFALSGGLGVSNIARWDGALWSPLDQGIGSFTTTEQVVHALAVDSFGNIIAGGGFLSAGTYAAPHLARFGCPPPPSCYPDCDASGSLDIDDFICFQTLYALSDPKADCDASGSLDIDDFICFQTIYALGC